MIDQQAKRCGSFVCKDNPFRLIREQESYSMHHRVINTGLQLRATLRAGSCAYPGCYPLYFVTSDGAALSFESVRENLKEIIYSIRHNLDDGWRVCGLSVNWEDGELFCEHSGERIRSAYAEED